MIDQEPMKVGQSLLPSPADRTLALPARQESKTSEEASFFVYMLTTSQLNAIKRCVFRELGISTKADVVHNVQFGLLSARPLQMRVTIDVTHNPQGRQKLSVTHHFALIPSGAVNGWVAEIVRVGEATKPGPCAVCGKTNCTCVRKLSSSESDVYDRCEKALLDHKAVAGSYEELLVSHISQEQWKAATRLAVSAHDELDKEFFKNFRALMSFHRIKITKNKNGSCFVSGQACKIEKAKPEQWKCAHCSASSSVKSNLCETCGRKKTTWKPKGPTSPLQSTSPKEENKTWHEGKTFGDAPPPPKILLPPVPPLQQQQIAAQGAQPAAPIPAPAPQQAPAPPLPPLLPVPAIQVVVPMADLEGKYDEDAAEELPDPVPEPPSQLDWPEVGATYPECDGKLVNCHEEVYVNSTGPPEVDDEGKITAGPTRQDTISFTTVFYPSGDECQVYFNGFELHYQRPPGRASAALDGWQWYTSKEGHGPRKPDGFTETLEGWLPIECIAGVTAHQQAFYNQQKDAVSCDAMLRSICESEIKRFASSTRGLARDQAPPSADLLNHPYYLHESAFDRLLRHCTRVMLQNHKQNLKLDEPTSENIRHRQEWRGGPWKDCFAPAYTFWLRNKALLLFSLAVLIPAFATIRISHMLGFSPPSILRFFFPLEFCFWLLVEQTAAAFCLLHATYYVPFWLSIGIWMTTHDGGKVKLALLLFFTATLFVSPTGNFALAETVHNAFEDTQMTYSHQQTAFEKWVFYPLLQNFFEGYFDDSVTAHLTCNKTSCTVHQTTVKHTLSVIYNQTSLRAFYVTEHITSETMTIHTNHTSRLEVAWFLWLEQETGQFVLWYMGKKSCLQSFSQRMSIRNLVQDDITYTTNHTTQMTLLMPFIVTRIAMVFGFTPEEIIDSQVCDSPGSFCFTFWGNMFVVVAFYGLLLALVFGWIGFCALTSFIIKILMLSVQLFAWGVSHDDYTLPLKVVGQLSKRWPTAL